MDRRDFLKNVSASSVAATVAATGIAVAAEENQPVVYFTRTITPEKMVEIFQKLNRDLPGKVAVKVHTGEPNGKHFIQAEFMKPLVELTNGTIVESNTAYRGRRARTEDHLKVVEQHGFTKIAPVDILDGEAETELPVSNGKQLKTNYVGANLKKYDSLLVLSHFKGHMMGGFGGALKNISIGIASAHGKACIHGAGDPAQMWTCEASKFLESMADASKSIVEFFDGKAAYVNVMNHLSVDCDCNGAPKKPEMADIGMLASVDPVALDQACVDLIYNSDDPGKAGLIARMESRGAVHILEAAEELGVGSRRYRLVEFD